MKFLPLILLATLPLLAQDPDPTLPEGHSHNGDAFNEGPRQAGPLMGNTGQVHLPVTTSWDQGQAYFDQGLGQLHGFWYYEAERSFRTILAHDPNCLMAYWGLSQANFENPKRAKAFIEKASELLKKSPPPALTPHENAYLTAEINLHDDSKEKDQKRRYETYLRAYEDLVLDFPNDLEAKALLVCKSWQYSRKGIPIQSHLGFAALLDQIFAVSPHHPARHYAIHLWDNRRHQEALPSAALCGLSAPGIAHMWHMPTHIYSRAQRYHDASWQLEASARVDHAHMQKNFLLPDQIHNYAHNNEWLARNYNHLGRPRDAIAMAKSLLANPRHPDYLTSPKSSFPHGRKRLLDTLELFELWSEALETTQSTWLETLPKPIDDLPRLRLLALAQFHLNQETPFQNTLATIDQHLTQALADQTADGEKARTKAESEKKNPKEIEDAVKKARDQHQRLISQFENTLTELRGNLAQLQGDLETARQALAKYPSNLSPIPRHLALNEHDKALTSARNLLEKKTLEAVPLAHAAFAFFQIEPTGSEWKEAFQRLRSLSSDLELDSPVFVRLAPLAQALGYPTDWRLPHPPAPDLQPRPNLNDLGPLHWSPPTAPDFTLLDQNRLPHALTAHRGTPLIVVFYLGAGCLHCTEQLTAIADRYHDFQNAALPVLAISTDSVTDLRKSQDNYSKGTIPFPIVSNHDLSIFKKYTAHDDFEGQPLHGTFLLDPQGRILWSDISAEPFMDLDFLLTESSRLLKLHPSPQG